MSEDTPTVRNGPLSRFTVLDLTRVRAGPTCIRQFGDWGANVIKIEAPGADDFSSRSSSDFQNLHRNKRSLSLNLKKPEGLAILKRLTETADVIAENYRPDVKHRLGIDYESMKAVNKGIVYVSMSGFGEDGPYVSRPGVDQIAQGLGGMMSVTGEPGRGPMRAGIPVADLATGLFGAIGALTALLEREVSGEGQWVQANLLASQIYMLDLQAARWTMGNEVPGQVGNDHPTNVPTSRYQTKDGYINIAPTRTMWPRFCEALGMQEVEHEEDFATGEARMENRAQVNEMIEKITVTKDSAEWIDILNEAGIPCGPIHTVDQMFDDPQVKHLGVTAEVISKSLGAINVLAQPIHLSRTDSEITTAAPEPGEQSDEILGEYGYSADEIEGFRADGVI